MPALPDAPAALDRVRIVLSRTTHPGNIGATARAMKTMGLRQLWLVAPAVFPSEIAHARASGADDILASARVVDSLAEALADTVFVAALSARRRELSLPRVLPRAAAASLITHTAAGEVALVFGNESSGLSNAELALCALPVTIPTAADFSSLNLAAAVQVLAYELRLAAAEPAAFSGQAGTPATHADFEAFIAHLERAVTASGFHDPRNPKRLLPRLRRLFNRVRLEREEVAILRGMLSTFEQPRKRG